MKFTQKDLLDGKCTMTEYCVQFVDEQVINIVRTSTIYKHLLRSKDHDNFMDITIKQWDTCTGSILCYLKSKFRKQEMFTQAKLFAIGKLTAKLILEREGKLKIVKDKCLTGNV